MMDTWTIQTTSGQINLNVRILIGQDGLSGK